MPSESKQTRSRVTANKKKEAENEKVINNDELTEEEEASLLNGEDLNNGSKSPACSTETSASASTSAFASMVSSNLNKNEEMMKLLATFLAAQSKPSERAPESPPSLHRKWDAAYVTPTFTIRKFEEHEKLHGHSNFKSWTKMIHLELAALNLLPFIQSEAAIEINLSPQRRTMLDAQALQLIRASVDRSVVKHLNNSYSAYSAYKMLEETFEKVRSLDYILLHRKFGQLKFRRGHDPIRYCADFENYIQQYRDLNTEFSDAFIATIFIEKIECKDDPDSPFYTFSSTVATLPPETQTYAYVKNSFIEIASKDKVVQPKKRKFENESKDKENQKRKKGQNMHPLTKEQIEKLQMMSKEDRAGKQCFKCGGYFHRADKCLNKGRVCFKCHDVGHESKDCRVDLGRDRK